MIGYSVDNRLFSNGLDAFYHAAIHTPHETVNFVFDDAFWSAQDWSIEPAQSFDVLLDTRARQLRDKYGYLILLFSGGTDSLLIYNVFRRLNLPIDEIVTIYGNTKTYLDKGCPHDVISWLVQNHWDSKTKITALPKIPHDLASINKLYRAQAGSWINQPFISNASADTWLYDRLLTEHQDKRPGIIMGVEKPTLLFRHGSWFATALDKIYRIYLPRIDQVEWFYTSRDLPALHIKQNYLLLHAAQKVKPKDATEWSTQIWSDNSYQDFCLATGRIGELIPGASEANKMLYRQNDRWALDTQLHDQGTRLHKLIADIMPQYLSRSQQYQWGQDLRAYMMRQGLYAHTDHDWHGIYSKMIKIGCND